MNRNKAAERERAETDCGCHKTQDDCKSLERIVFVFKPIDDVVKSKSKNQNYSSDAEKFDFQARQRKNAQNHEDAQNWNRGDFNCLAPRIKEFHQDDDDDERERKHCGDYFCKMVEARADVLDFVLVENVRVGFRQIKIKIFVRDF